MDYDDEWLVTFPESLPEFFAENEPTFVGQIGCNNCVYWPSSVAWSDCFFARRLLKATGKIVDKDIITNVQKALQTLKEVRYTQVKFRNHCLDRCRNVRQNGRFLPSQVFRSPEICHVLKLRNCIQIDDIKEQQTAPNKAEKDIDLWTDWINGTRLLTQLEVVVYNLILLFFLSSLTSSI